MADDTVQSTTIPAGSTSTNNDLHTVAKGWRSRLKEWVYSVLMKPWAGAVITVLLVFVGIWASLFFEEIKSSVPFKWEIHNPAPNWYAILFWIGLVLSSFGWGIRQRALDREQKKNQATLIEATASLNESQRDISHQQKELQGELKSATDSLTNSQQNLSDRQKGLQDRLDSSVKDLLHVLSTMPSKRYLNKQVTIIDECEDMVWQMRVEDSRRQDISAAIRLILLRIAELAREFDESEPYVEYAANIMIGFLVCDGSRKRGIADLTARQSRYVQKLLHFVEPGTSIKNLGRVLVLRQDLTATTKVIESDAAQAQAPCDKSMIPFALGVPRAVEAISYADENKRSHVLPGAPSACVNKAAYHCFDTSQLRLRCEQENELSESVLSMIHAYFTEGNGSHVRSFVSIPLFAPPGNDDVGTNSFAAMNIHSSNIGLFTDSEARKLFFASAYPLTRMLCRLLMELRHQEGKRKRWWKIPSDSGIY